MAYNQEGNGIMAKRSKDVQVNLEPLIHKILVDLVARSNSTQSGYIRTLIVEDLRNQGLLTDTMIADMMSGC